MTQGEGADATRWRVTGCSFDLPTESGIDAGTEQAEPALQAIKDRIKTGYASAMWRSGLLSAWLGVRGGRGRIAILNYHDIAPDRFESHVAALVDAYSIISLDECVASLRGEAEPPPNSVVLTFDDAYRQFHDDLYPIVRRFEIPVAMFVPTTSIDDGSVLWFNRVKGAIHGSADELLRVGDLSLPPGGSRREAYRKAISYLNGQPIPTRDAMLGDLFDQSSLGDDVTRACRPMTWGQMRHLREYVAFGVHTRTHPSMAMLDADALRDEIAGARGRLVEELGCDARHFAYPFGQPANISAEVTCAVAEAGFECALTTVRGSCTAGDDLFRLPRLVADEILNGRVLAAQLSDLWLHLTT